MDRAARPATIEDLKRLAKVLDDQDVEYLLIGGYALFGLGCAKRSGSIAWQSNAQLIP